MTETVVVTQADREAAAGLADELDRTAYTILTNHEGGSHDHARLMQKAAAALRSTPAPVRPTSEVEGLRMRLRAACDFLEQLGLRDDSLGDDARAILSRVDGADLNAIERREWETSDAPEERGEGEQS